MRDKTEQIIKAAIKVFITKGLQATTQEIAQEANVAEITLFRKYTNKQNLFVTVVRNVLEKKFHSSLMRMAAEKDTELFIKQIIANRLEVLHMNESLVKMLISESLMGKLPEEIHLPNLIYHSLKNGLDYHFEQLNRTVDTDLCARQLGGIFLSYLILPKSIDYIQLSDEEKAGLVHKHAKSVLALISE